MSVRSLTSWRNQSLVTSSPTGGKVANVAASALAESIAESVAGQDWGDVERFARALVTVSKQKQLDAQADEAGVLIP